MLGKKKKNRYCRYLIAFFDERQKFGNYFYSGNQIDSAEMLIHLEDEIANVMNCREVYIVNLMKISEVEY